MITTSLVVPSNSCFLSVSVDLMINHCHVILGGIGRNVSCCKGDSD